MRGHEDEIRKITLKLGFNILILPKDQSLADLYADDFAAHTMPESYGQRLVQANVVTIRHLLPSLQERVYWNEAQRGVLLFGTRGELDKRDQKKPLLDAVPPGKVVLGSELGRAHKVGDKISLSLTRRGPNDAVEDLPAGEFVVHGVRSSRGNKDDITVWVHLADAQRILKKENRINALLALECDCSAQRLANVRDEVSRILPETQVIEYQSQAIARAEARNQAAAKRAELRDRHESFAALLVPLIVLGSMVLLGVLAFLNVEDRVGEIGILRALGVGARQVFVLFLAKALAAGVIGAVLGYAAGTAAGLWLSEPAETPAIAFSAGLLAVALLAAPALCALASLLPALRAARQDPAIVLQQD